MYSRKGGSISIEFFGYTHYFMKEYLNMFIQTWINTFDIKGEASKKDLVVFWVISFILVNVIFQLDIELLRYFAYVSIIPNITLIIRRLNSLEKSRKNVFLVFIPIVNLYLGMLLLSDEKKSENDSIRRMFWFECLPFNMIFIPC